MSSLPFWLDAVLCALVLAGAAFSLLGSWALARLGSFLERLHGPSVVTTCGVGCALLASGLWFAWRGQFGVQELLIGAFLFMTAPVSAHLLVKAALQLDPRLRQNPPR